MLVREQPPLHLTYCLNIHPGETWAENLAALRTYVPAIKARVAPDRPFGLGLRLSRAAADALRAPAARQALRQELAERGCYAFSVNGFPYGRFHGARVKEQVYAPDWRTPERLEYTCLLADILADLLPEGMPGSLSTLPGSFKPWLRHGTEASHIAVQLIAAARHLAGLREKTGREIHLGLEPEPWCFLETTDEVLRFFEGPLAAACVGPAERGRLWPHLGVCLDTCHAALQFETPLAALRRYRAAGVRISKIQLSAALALIPDTERGTDLCHALAAFREPVYLHQTLARLTNGTVLSWPDLPEALPVLNPRRDLAQVRVHFHVPLFWTGGPRLGSTAAELTAEFFREACAATEHWEIETYTFDVLPPELRADGVVASVAREFDWVLARLNAS